jgi:hypothetical protein
MVCVEGSALDCLVRAFLVDRILDSVAGSALDCLMLALLVDLVAGCDAASALGCLRLALLVDRVVGCDAGSALPCLRAAVLVDLVRRGSDSRATRPPGESGCERVRILTVDCKAEQRPTGRTATR